MVARVLLVFKIKLLTVFAIGLTDVRAFMFESSCSISCIGLLACVKLHESLGFPFGAFGGSWHGFRSDLRRQVPGRPLTVSTA